MYTPHCPLSWRGPYSISLVPLVSWNYLSLVLQLYDGLPRDACEVIATDFSVPTLLMTTSTTPVGASRLSTLKPRGRIEFSAGGLALVSFFAGSGRLSLDFHGGVLQPRFFMRYRLTRYYGIPLHILGSQSRDVQWRRTRQKSKIWI